MEEDHILVTTEEQRTIRRRTSRRDGLRVRLPLPALLAGTYLVAGRAFAGEKGGSPAGTLPAEQKVSSTGGQPGQTKYQSPLVCAANYEITQTEQAAAVPGTDLVTGSLCDDCSFSISLPFAYSLYGQSFTSVTATSNGQLDFGAPV